MGCAPGSAPMGSGRCLAAAEEQQLQLNKRRRVDRQKFSWEGRANGSQTKEADWGAARVGALPPLRDAAGLARLPLNL